MTTVAAPRTSASTPQRKLVEMNWDPITRIVGSLIDFPFPEICAPVSKSNNAPGASTRAPSAGSQLNRVPYGSPPDMITSRSEPSGRIR